jgi:tetratricopeptide (TPR) repeat protein
MGTAHLEAGRYKEAETWLEEYLDENPQSALAHLNLFKVYLAQDERDLAWDEIQTAVRLDPNRLDSLRQLYFLFRETERQEEGMEYLSRLALENPRGFAPLLVKAQVLAEEANWPDAQEALQEALKRVPHNEELLLFYSSELGKRGQRKELIQLLESETEPLPLSLTINLALAFSQNGQTEKGRKLLEHFLQRRGLSPVEKGRVKNLLREFEDHL